MVKIQTKYVCQQCGYETSGWLGKCPNCHSWASLVEQLIEPTSSSSRRSDSYEIVKQSQSLAKIISSKEIRIATSSFELNRVLGGGIVAGSVVLLAGSPGIGKSTLLLQLAYDLAKKGKVLYVSGEESPQQIKLRSQRLNINSANIFLSTQANVDLLCHQIKEEKPTLVIVDSIQTLTTSDLTGTAGSVGQVRESANRLQQQAKELNIPLFLIGHVTKEGAIAGPKVLEHLVDTVLYLEGERYHQLRILRGVKNRFGATDEVGLFTMEETGLIDVVNPASLFLTTTTQKTAGSAIIVTLEGTRPILIEIQALTTPSKMPFPRRVTNGFDFNRLQMLLAIIVKHLKLPLADFDIYLNVASGFKIREPAADLGVCLSIISSLKSKPLPAKTAFIGEVGLLGEIRRVIQEERRIKEAKKLGFKNVFTSQEVNLVQLVKKLF